MPRRTRFFFFVIMTACAYCRNSGSAFCRKNSAVLSDASTASAMIPVFLRFDSAPRMFAGNRTFSTAFCLAWQTVVKPDRANDCLRCLPPCFKCGQTPSFGYARLIGTCEAVCPGGLRPVRCLRTPATRSRTPKKDSKPDAVDASRTSEILLQKCTAAIPAILRHAKSPPSFLMNAQKRTVYAASAAGRDTVLFVILNV